MGPCPQEQFKVMQMHECHLNAHFWIACNHFITSRWRLTMLILLQDDIFVSRAPGRLDVMGGIGDYSGSLVLQVKCALGGEIWLLKYCNISTLFTFRGDSCQFMNLSYAVVDANWRSVPCCSSTQSTRKTALVETCKGTKRKWLGTSGPDCRSSYLII